jgi:lipopolysaccharide/colanic/teichoic acid biosynthesis glycosyltransferase
MLTLDGAVERIQRYYDGVTWPQRGDICCTCVAAGGLQSTAASAFTRLSTLRNALAEQQVFSRDVALWSNAVDLPRESGLLALNAHVLRRGGPTSRPLIAPDARIAASARLIGAVAVQSGAAIEADAVVIGPAILGARARVGAGAVVAQAIVGPCAAVAARSVIRQVVWCGQEAVGAAAQRVGRAAPEASTYEAPARLTIHSGYSRRSLYEPVKRAVDAVAAALGLMALAPLMLAIAALIRLTSRGPALFAHQREGRHGGAFKCYKFRTMREGAHAEQRALYGRSVIDGPQFKLPGDPRITAVGAILRLTNLDELPQLINVVLGHMSLIGPRPSPFRENQLCVSWRRARLSVRPGITGLWQICRHDRASSDFHQWIHYDTLYVRHLSAWLDFKILLATFLTMGGRWSVPANWIVPHIEYRARPGLSAARAG